MDGILGIPDLQVFGYARVDIVGAAPVYGPVAGPLMVRGFDATVAPVDNGAGDFTLTFPADHPVPIDNAIVLVMRRGAAIASELMSSGHVWPTPNTIRITTLQEGAAGIVSAPTDVPVDVLILGFQANPPL